MAFQHTHDALAWCAAVQRGMLDHEWPASLLEHPSAAEEYDPDDNRYARTHEMTLNLPRHTLHQHQVVAYARMVCRRVIYRGLRVRMGVHAGLVRGTVDALTRRIEYTGPVVSTAARITALALGGHVVLSQAALESLDFAPSTAEDQPIIECLGSLDIPGMPPGMTLYEYLIPGLEGRSALDDRGGGDHGKAQSDDSSVEDLEESERSRDETPESGDGEDVGMHVDRRGRRRHHHQRSSRRQYRRRSSRHHGNLRPEATFRHGGAVRAAADNDDEEVRLTSANACRWILSAEDITVGEALGPMVHRGRWKGIDVVVKRFGQNPRTVSERRLLDFRAEIAVLSNLHHPNTVLFIGTLARSFFLVPHSSNQH
jgi:hypothetical protein